MSSRTQANSRLCRILGARVLLTLALVHAVSFDFLRADDALPEKPRFPIIGYVPDYRMSTLDPAVGKFVTELVYFSAIPEPSGDIDRKRLNAKHLEALRTIKAAHRVALILCVGGWERSAGFAALAASPPARARFVASLVAFCRENQFDGVDLDWEHPANEAEARNYGTLLATLKAGFAPHKLRVSIAAAGWQTLTPEAIASVDRIHLMAYDAEGRHATLPFAKAEVERLLKQGAPPGKICLGLPFYGRGIGDRSKSSTYETIVRKYHPAADVDEVDGLYFNNVSTIERKTRYALESKLGGVMIWELGQDTRDEQSLLRAIHRVASDTRP